MNYFSGTTNIEDQVLIIKPSQYLNIGIFLLTLGSFFIGQLFLIVPLIVVCCWKILVLYCVSWSMLHESIVESTGVFNVTTDEVMYFRIKDVHLYQPLLYRLVGLSRLTIITSDKTKPTIVLDGIYQGKKKMQAFKALAIATRKEKGVQEFDIR